MNTVFIAHMKQKNGPRQDDGKLGTEGKRMLNTNPPSFLSISVRLSSHAMEPLLGPLVGLSVAEKENPEEPENQWLQQLESYVVNYVLPDLLSPFHHVGNATGWTAIQEALGELDVEDGRYLSRNPASLHRWLEFRWLMAGAPKPPPSPSPVASPIPPNTPCVCGGRDHLTRECELLIWYSRRVKEGIHRNFHFGNPTEKEETRFLVVRLLADKAGEKIVCPDLVPIHGDAEERAEYDRRQAKTSSAYWALRGSREKEVVIHDEDDEEPSPPHG